MNRLLTIGLLLIASLFLGACDTFEQEDTISSGGKSRIQAVETSEIPQRLEELSDELKSRTCLLPRRTVQLISHSVKVREEKSQKVFWQTRLNGENKLYRTSEFTSDCQIIQFATLLCRKGYYIYALRKLLI